MGTEDERQRRRDIERHPERRKASLAKYAAKQETKARIKEWIEQNGERYKAAKTRYYVRNKERICREAAEYAKNNAGWKAATCALRRTRKMQATPKWVDTEAIQRIYEDAKHRSTRDGSWNLQLLSPSENSRKGNRFEDSGN